MTDDKNRFLSDTHPGYDLGASADAAEARPSHPDGQLLEVEMVHERGHMGMPISPWPALEVWTQNHVYVTDWHMKCVEVRSRPEGHADPDHPLLGAYLAGGQRQEEGHMEMTYPCPRPGTAAVFEYRGVRKGYVDTSPVTRVVLRLRVLTVPKGQATPTWDQLVSAE